MKKIIFLFLTTLSWTAVLGQINTIKIQKEKPRQNKLKPVVTLAGHSKGKCSAIDILTDRKLKISNNSNEYKIISFVAVLYHDDMLSEYGVQGDSLPNKLKSDLYKVNYSKRPKLYIEKIKAVDANQDTALLKSIELTLTK